MAKTDLPAVLPQAVTVRFPRYDTDSGSPVFSGSYYHVTVTLASLALPEFNGVKPNSGTELLHVGQAATYTGGVLQNGTALNAYAAQAATDWYRYQASPVDVSLAGVCPWAPEGLSDRVEFRYAKDRVTTDVRRPPFMDRAADLAPLLMAAPSSAAGSGGSIMSVARVHYDYGSGLGKPFVTGTPGYPADSLWNGVAVPNFWVWLVGPDVSFNPGGVDSPISVTGIGPGKIEGDSFYSAGTVVSVHENIIWFFRNSFAGSARFLTSLVTEGVIFANGYGFSPDDDRDWSYGSGERSMTITGQWSFAETGISKFGEILTSQFTGLTQYVIQMDLTVIVWRPRGPFTISTLADLGGSTLVDSSGNTLTEG